LAAQPSRDPIEEYGGANLYSFVYNNPIHWFDDFGTKPKTASDRGMFQVDPAYRNDLSSGKKEEIANNNPPIAGTGYDVVYFPDASEECPKFKLIQVISYDGDEESYAPFLDNNKKDKFISPGYRESGGAPDTTDENEGMFDAPMGGMTPTEKTGRPKSKGTWYVEICAVCCEGEPKERILGCVRFDFDNSTGKITPGQYGAEKTPADGFKVPSLDRPTRHYNDGRYQHR
jgi:hypothetical protein